ncbi:putative ubiquinone biosynthesis protein COQ9 [Cercophora samala]|uniref:Ubiquinone biosynthesis protein n=1 Tax=Cercophora samala TaxID=330535 RepID=A0AA39ZEV8_9PEZI|nr:putative ubiquinone biosynthesis protein COQ9 [Cercophora samala]
MASPAAVHCSGAARRILLLPTTVRPATRSLPGRLPAVASRSITSPSSTSRPQSRPTPKLQPPSSSSSSPPPRQPLQTRTYHSTTHPPPPGPFTPAETTLLTTALAAHVPTHGFTLPSLTLAARDLSLLDISPSFLGPSPTARLIHFHLYTARAALARLATQHGDLLSGGLSVSEKVELLTWLRLKQNEPVIQHWQQALAVMAQPSQVPTAVRELALLADEVYFLAGDKSVDPSWYTKRGALSGIYAAAELFMTTDKSEGFQETRRFLRRRLQEAEELGGVVKSVGEWVGFTASAGVNVLRSKGVRI